MSAAPRVSVIGAGAVGAACAAALARAGCRVQVFQHPGRSTTAVSGGHLLLQSKQPGPVLELAQRSLALLADFARGREDALGYRQRGSLLLAADPAEAETLFGRYTALRDAGVPVEWLDGPQVRRLEPAVGSNVVSGSLCPSDGQVDPVALAGAWLRAAQAAGATCLTRRVTGFVSADAAGITGVRAGEELLPADAVVLAAGPWSGEIAALAGLSLPLRPRRGVLLVGRPEGVLTGRPLLGGTYLEAKYSRGVEVAFSLQQHPDGTCVLGGSREWVDFDDTVPAALPGTIIAAGARYLPALQTVDWGEVRVGFRPWTSEGAPYIGGSSVPGLFLACGHEGDGITLAAATAERVTTAVLAATS